jgi:hypothetical protein
MWPLIAAAVVSAAASVYSSIKNNDAADKATSATKELTKTQAEIANSQWERYIKTFAPLENKMVADVSRPLENQPYFSSMMAGIDKQYSDIKANTDRTLSGKYQYGSGVREGRLNTIDLDRARTKSKAYSTAEQNRLTNMLNVASIGRNLPASAQNGLSSAAGTYGNLAAMYGNAATAGWGSVGSTASNLAQQYYLNNMINNSSNYSTTASPMVTNGYEQTYNGVYDPTKMAA